MISVIGEVMNLEVSQITRKDVPNSEYGYVILYLTKLGTKNIKLLSVAKFKFEERLGHSVTDEDFVKVFASINLADFCGVSGYVAKGALNNHYNSLVRDFKKSDTVDCRILEEVNHE